MQIADLTGNVPLAVVGAIFKFPDAPTPEEVIEGLKKNLVGTLSPAELHLKLMCLFLSHIIISHLN